MSRTWDENRVAINQLWPVMEFTDEERRLWKDDLSNLNQDVLYDAIRNVKRNNDTNYPQLKWVRDEYRVLHASRALAERKRQTNVPAEPFVPVVIDKKQDERLRQELVQYIDTVTVADKQRTVDLIADKAASEQIEMATAFRLVSYLLKRLGLDQGGIIGGST